MSQENPPPLKNDLQKVVAPITPAVQNALEILQKIPETLSVAMSGSGPSCFALFSDMNTAQKAMDQNLDLFMQAGLDSWCCSFRTKGVALEL